MNEIKPRRRILVIDDEPAILRFIGSCLRIFGYEVVTATCGEEALKLVEREKLDIVLMDVIMPGMGGLELLEKLRTVSDIPVIVFSARSSSRDEALRLGANDFITKPFTPDQLVKKISVALP